MQAIPVPHDCIEGAISIEAGDGWTRPWRIRHDELPLHHPGLQMTGGKASGVRVRFATAAAAVGLRVQPCEEDRCFDLVRNNEILETVTLPANATEVAFAPGAAEERVLEIWLPPNAQVVLEGVLVDDGASVEPSPDTRRRWITYGSSITHCSGANSPARIWPGVAARARDLHLTSLGFGGNCHLDPLVARAIRDRPADLITLKLGINIQGGGTLSERTFAWNALGFIRILRERHAETPIGVISPILCPPRETTRNAAGLSLTDMRAALREAVETLRTWGDEHVHYFDGLTLFGEADVEAHLPDLLHPDGDGYEIMGQRAAEHILPKLT